MALTVTPRVMLLFGRLGIRRCFQEILVSARVRVMALDAGLFVSVGMALHLQHVLFLMTLEADLTTVLEQKARFIGLVRAVTG